MDNTHRAMRTSGLKLEDGTVGEYYPGNFMHWNGAAIGGLMVFLHVPQVLPKQALRLLPKQALRLLPKQALRLAQLWLAADTTGRSCVWLLLMLLLMLWLMLWLMAVAAGEVGFFFSAIQLQEQHLHVCFSSVFSVMLQD